MDYPIEKYEFKVYTKVNTDGTKTKYVIALSTFAGRVVKGVAKCCESDSFDIETGMKLAAARCDLKVRAKRLRRAERRRHETAVALEKAALEAESMEWYYQDSLQQFEESTKRLVELEDLLA